MKLGFVSAALFDLDLERVLAFATAERFACVEVLCWPVGKAERKYAGVTHLDVSEFSRAQAEDVLALCGEYGVEISALGYYPNPLDPASAAAKKAVEHLKKVILAAEKLGLNVNTFIGRNGTQSVDDNWPRFCKTWKPLVAFAGDRGVKIGIENCPMLFTQDEWPGGKNLAYSPAIWRRIWAEIPDCHLGLNYDPSHLVWQQMDWLRPVREFKDRLFHIHAKDVRIDRDRLNESGILAPPLNYHQPCVPGLGDIDWGRFIGTLKQAGYDGAVCIEVEDDSFGKTLDGRQKALRVARNALAPFFE